MTLTLKVPSMVCEGCAETITKAIKNVDSSANISIDLASKIVTLESSISEEALTQAITNTGHTVE